MKKTRRLLFIIRTLLRYRLDSFIDRDKLPLPLKLLFGILQLRPRHTEPRAVRLRRALQDLGPIFIKFGQLLSTRRDLLPDDLADELAKLQDRVPPFPNDQSVALIERALGQPVSQAFAEFQSQPLASASVAQVHAARLHDGSEVVVKVIRPNIRQVIDQDLQLLFCLARILQRYSSDGRRLRPVEVVDDYQHTILDELDLKREAANASLLRRNFEIDAESEQLLQVPRIIWDLSCREVLVMQRMYGIPVADIAALKQRDVDLKILAERGVEIFFTQVFEHNFFHADMHPGNIFVDASCPQSPQYIAIDCAIMGSLSDFDRYYLARNLLAVFERDYALVARLHIESGWVPAGTNAQAFESMIRSACEPVFEKPLAEISFGTLLLYLFQAARRFGMEVQPSLILLQKTLLNIEGLGRQLYPQLDLWQTAQPYLQRWMAERYSPQRLLETLQQQLPSLLEQLPQLPDLLFNKLSDNGDSGKGGEKNRRQLERRIEQLQRRQRMHTALLAFAVLSTTGYLFFA